MVPHFPPSAKYWRSYIILLIFSWYFCANEQRPKHEKEGYGRDNINIITLLHAHYILVQRMCNPHYHSFSPSIPGIWYRRRSFVWKISQHRIQRLTSHTVHLMTCPHAPAGLVFFFFLVLSLLGLNSLSAHLCSWQTLLWGFPCGTTGMWFLLVSRRTFIRPRVGERALLSIFGALFLESEEVVLFGVSGGDFFLGQSSSGSRWAYPIASFQAWWDHETGTPLSSQYRL